MRTTTTTRLVTGSHRVGLSTALALFTSLALPASAATIIPVTNHSFEAPVLAADGGYSLTPTGWTLFATSGTSSAVAYNPPETHFSGATGGGTPAGADGTNVLTTWTGATGARAGAHQTIAGTPLTAGQTYTMTVAIGDYKNRIPNRWHLSISTSSMAVGSYLVDYSPTNWNTLLTDDAFTDISVQYTATGSESQIGEDLRITIWSENPDVALGGTDVPFDNVRLTAIPEPSGALLGGIGCLLLLRRRSRCP